MKSWPWLFTHLIPIIRKKGSEVELCEFEVSLVFIASSANQKGRPCLKKKDNQSRLQTKKATKNQIQKEFCPIIFGHNSKRVKVLIVILFKYIHYSYYYYTILHIRQSSFSSPKALHFIYIIITPVLLSLP